MNKKIYIVIAALIIVLYAALVVYQSNASVGELFGYVFYVVVIGAIVAGIWILIKPPKKVESESKS